MKNAIFKLDSNAETAEIYCDLFDARLTVCASDDKQLKVVYPDGKNINVACGENGLIINQSKRLLHVSSQHITLYVPAYIVPDIKLCLKHASVIFEGGIYGDMSINAEDGKLYLSGCAFASCEVIGGDIEAYLADVTVKGNLFAQLTKGNVLAENSFIYRAECRIKNGNLGFVNLNCKKCVFEAYKGNISASIVGVEEDFSTAIRAKSGTANRDGAEREGAQKSVRAYTEKGNIMLDFVGERVEIEEAATTDAHCNGDGETAQPQQQPQLYEEMQL